MAERLRFRLPWMTSAPIRRIAEPQPPSPDLPPSTSGATDSPQPPPPSTVKTDSPKPPPPSAVKIDSPKPPPPSDSLQLPPPSDSPKPPPPSAVKTDSPKPSPPSDSPQVPPPSDSPQLPPPSDSPQLLPPSDSPQTPPPSDATNVPPTPPSDVTDSTPPPPPPPDATAAKADSPQSPPHDATAAKGDSPRSPHLDATAAKVDAPRSPPLPKMSAPQSPGTSPARAAARGKAPASPVPSFRNGIPIRSPSRTLSKRESEIKSPLSSAEITKFISEPNQVDAPNALSPVHTLLASNSKKEVQYPSSPLSRTNGCYSMFNSQDNDVNDFKGRPPLVPDGDKYVEFLSSSPLIRDSGDAPQYITGPNDTNDIDAPPPNSNEPEKTEITKNSNEPEKIINEENFTKEEVEKLERKDKKKERQPFPKVIGQSNNTTLQKEIKGNVTELMSKINEKMAGEAPVSAVTLAGENTGAVMHLGSESSKQDGPVHIHRSYKANSPVMDQRREDAMTGEDLPNNTFINSNSQSINNSILFGSSFHEKSPGVNLVYSYHLPSITNKSHVPTFKRRCLRGLFSESTTDSDSQQKKHGCRA